MAILGGHINCVQTFITELKKTKTDAEITTIVNTPNKFGETALHFCIDRMQPAMLQLLMSEGHLDVNATTVEKINGVDRCKHVLSTLDLQEAHMKDHDEDGHGGCGHHHEPVDFNAHRAEIKIVQSLLEKAGVKESAVKFEKPAVPVEQLPENVSQGFLQDNTLKTVESRFGGALWDKTIEVFYTGKKPKVGYSVQVNMNFIDTAKASGLSFTWLRGIISSVAPTGDRFTATLSLNLNVDHKDKLKEQFGKTEWEATLVWYPFNEYPWVLVKLVPLQQDSEHTHAKLLQLALDNESKFGRKVAKVEQESSACMVLKGDNHHHHHHDDDEEEEGGQHEHKVMVAADLTSAGVAVTLEDGTTTLVKHNVMQYFQHLVSKVAHLRQHNIDTAVLSVNGKPLDWDQIMKHQHDDDDDDEEHDHAGHHH